MIDGRELDGAVAAAQRHEDWGWTALYRALAPIIAGYLRARGSPEPDDLTAEVFVQAVKGIDKFSGDGTAFRSWIFCIAHNKLVDEMRRNRRHPVRPVPDAGRHLVQPGSVEDQALRRLAEDNIRRMFARLSPDQRNVLYLRMIGGLTLEESARVLNKPVSAVKALQRRGLGAIRRDLPGMQVSNRLAPAFTNDWVN